MNLMAPPDTLQEAIKDSSPADITEEDEAEVEEAEEEGGLKEAAVKTKTKTKSHILGLFRSGGKKAAGARGDVSVDGKGKRVRQGSFYGSGCCRPLILEQIGTKIDKILFRGHVKDEGEINCAIAPCVDDTWWCADERSFPGSIGRDVRPHPH